MQNNRVGHVSKGITVVANNARKLNTTITQLFSATNTTTVIVIKQNIRGKRTITQDVARTANIPIRVITTSLNSVSSIHNVIPTTSRHFNQISVLIGTTKLASQKGILGAAPRLFSHVFTIGAHTPFFLVRSTTGMVVHRNVRKHVIGVNSVSTLINRPFLTPCTKSGNTLTALAHRTNFTLVHRHVRIGRLSVN